ncbi:MAG: GYF domain-containing protein, partial [Gemmataceae bacterium]
MARESSEYYLLRNNKPQGPYSSNQLKQMVKSGHIVPHDRVCKAGGSKWFQAGEIRGLFTNVPVATPVAAPPSMPAGRPVLAGGKPSLPMGKPAPPRPPRRSKRPLMIGSAAAAALVAVVAGLWIALAGSSDPDPSDEEPTPSVAKQDTKEDEKKTDTADEPMPMTGGEKPPMGNMPDPAKPEPKPNPEDTYVRGEARSAPAEDAVIFEIKSAPGEDLMVAMAKAETSTPTPKPTPKPTPTPEPFKPPVSDFKPTPVPAQVAGNLNVSPKPIASDSTVKFDYPIVYVRVPRKGDNVGTNWTEISNPVYMDPGGDLMLLQPDGTEEVLVKGGEGSVTDPMVSFDGEWVYYSLFHDMKGGSIAMGPPAGADIYKIHVPTKKIVQLTKQEFTPNLGAALWSKDFRTEEEGKSWFNYGVFNMGPCPLPGGKLVFASNRNGFKPPKRLPNTLQLFVMDDDGSNVECIGHLNLGMALHPTVLMDGRIMFSSLESQGLRHSILWGLWTINPDGTGWGPMVSAFIPGESPSAYHFQTQMSDGTIVAEEYYNQTSNGMGSFVRFPTVIPEGKSAFGPGYTEDPRNPLLPNGRLDDGRVRARRLPFSPFGIDAITRFARANEGAADYSVRGNRNSPRVGKVTHPSAAPDNHLLCVWSPGPVNGGYTVNVPAVDGGLYLIKEGKVVNEPGELLLIKNDPKWNEQWPRALVRYERIYGMKEPRYLPPLANNGSLSPHLPENTPYGLVGTSSLYKRESYPNGKVLPDTVTAAFAGGNDATGYRDLDPFNSADLTASLNWITQGADAGLYSNDEVHAIRILVMEPTTDRHKGFKSGVTFRSHANERLRILGEIPVRKFTGDDQPKDPDGNPDTSFLAKIPADTAFTFQTLDKRGMVLNMAQTWHQVRPGEIRHDCGGCHAHSQQPTLFKDTLAAKPEYEIFDLTKQTPLLTTKANDQSKKKWDKDDTSGLRFEPAVKNVEYYRDIRPIFQKSCVACHSKQNPAGNLVLDDDAIVSLPNNNDVPGTYYRLCMDYAGRFGNKPILGSWKGTNASRYVRMF